MFGVCTFWHTPLLLVNPDRQVTQKLGLLGATAWQFAGRATTVLRMQFPALLRSYPVAHCKQAKV